MATISLPSSLIIYTNKHREIETNSSSLKSALLELKEKYPDLAPHLFDENNNLLLHVSIFVNNEQVDLNNFAHIAIKPETKIDILMALSGG